MLLVAVAVPMPMPVIVPMLLSVRCVRKVPCAGGNRKNGYRFVGGDQKFRTKSWSGSRGGCAGSGCGIGRSKSETK